MLLRQHFSQTLRLSAHDGFMSAATVRMCVIVFRIRNGTHVVWRVLPLPLPFPLIPSPSSTPLPILCVCCFCVCICVHIPGTDTRPWRLLHHQRLSACCCGKPSSQTCLLRRCIAVVTDIRSNMDLNMNWKHVKTLIPTTTPCFCLYVFMCLFHLIVIMLTIVYYVSAVRSSQTDYHQFYFRYCRTILP